MPAETMYNAARQDYVGGKYDLAVQEFADYLKYYGNTELRSQRAVLHRA